MATEERMTIEERYKYLRLMHGTHCCSYRQRHLVRPKMCGRHFKVKTSIKEKIQQLSRGKEQVAR